jgi:hypothetical protein
MTARLALAVAVAGLLLVPAGAQAARACRAEVARGVLPVWARTGFSERRPRLPHTVARGGSIAALFFADPLRSPPSRRVANKILWVARHTPSRSADLRISAQRMRGIRRVGHHVIRVVRGGPGPSYVNLPAKGCWRLTLSWSRRRDVVDLQYR